jgi:hypothetical protein
VKAVVVGGHTRNIGKTAVASGLIATLPEYRWTAIKITQYGHGVCSINGRACDCAVEDHPFAILEERDRTGRSDTSRFLAAGAARSLWVRTKQGQLEKALPALDPTFRSTPFLIIESNSILRYLRPDLYLVVFSFRSDDFKKSAEELLARADAAVFVDEPVEKPVWSRMASGVLARIPRFPVRPPEYTSADLTAHVRARIGAPTAAKP